MPPPSIHEKPIEGQRGSASHFLSIPAASPRGCLNLRPNASMGNDGVLYKLLSTFCPGNVEATLDPIFKLRA